MSKNYDQLNFTIKDCLYGQVRAIDDNVYRGYGISGKALPSTIPVILKPFIKKQQIITWDNATGMNPLWEQAPGDNVIHESYGDMIRDAYEISVHNGLTYVPDMVDIGLTVDQYDVKITEDHNNNYAMLCLSLGFWWHIHRLLNQPDVLEYDYLIVRQMDTWFYPLLTKENLYTIFEYFRRQVLLSRHFEEPTMPLYDIPVTWAVQYSNNIFPMSTWIESFFYMFNKPTVEILQKNFFLKILQEIEIFYLRNGKNTNPILGKPGVLFHHVAIKNDITVIDTSNNTFCWIPDRRTVSCSNYGRNERNITKVKLE